MLKMEINFKIQKFSTNSVHYIQILIVKILIENRYLSTQYMKPYYEGFKLYF